MASALTQETHWRTQGPYISTLTSKASLLEETRLFLGTYGQTNDVEATTRILLHNVLAQRSRSTRSKIIQILKIRLTQWNPPAWVLKDLVTFAGGSNLDALCAALLLHVPRQDHVLYDFVQQVIVPHQQRGEMRIFVSDVQTFFDASQREHPEIGQWSFETRLRQARGMLATLRDYGLLKGEVNKYIALPTVPQEVVHHLIRLLKAEGIPEEQMASHPDWQLWLWSSAQAQAAITSFLKQEQIA